MKKFKNILFVSALLSMTVFMSCTEDDDLEDIENGDKVSNDSTDVSNDSTNIVPETLSFIILGEDTILLGLGALEYYGIEDEGNIPFLGYTKIDGEPCFELPFNTDIILQGGTYTVDQLNTFMEAESQEEFEALAEEYGPGNVVAIFSWLDHNEEALSSGEYVGGTRFFNENFPNYTVASIEELNAFIEGKYEETYGSACMECEEAYQNACAGDEMTFEIWDEETEDYMEVTEIMSGERLYETYLYSDNCRLTGIDRTWMDEVCSMEDLSFGNLINEFEIGMISANENGEVVDQFYDVSNVTLSLEILGDGQYSINASGDATLYDEESEEAISDFIPFTMSYTGVLYEENFEDEDDYDEDDYFEDCFIEELSEEEGWWVDSVMLIYPDAEIDYALLNICETGDYIDEHLIVGIYDGSFVDEEDEEIDYFCEIVFENITQELIYNGCANCDFTDIDIDEQGYWTGYLDSAYQDASIDHIEIVDCSEFYPEDPRVLNIYLDNGCVVTFNDETETIWSEYCETCTITEIEVTAQGYWSEFIPEDEVIMDIILDECVFDDRLPESFLHINFESGCGLVFDDIEEDLVADFCSEGPDEEYCSISEVPSDEEGYWLDILNGPEFDSTYVIDQMLIEACRSEFEDPEADLRIAFLVNTDSSVRIISFDEMAQEIAFDSDEDSLDNWSLISLNDTQWAAMIADEYPDQTVESVYKNSYEDDYESWNDIFVFFEDDCLVIFDDNDGMIWEDLCNGWSDEDDSDGVGRGRKELWTKSFFRKTISSTITNSKLKQFAPTIRGKKTALIKKGVIRNKVDINIYAKRNNSNIKKVKKSQFSFLR
ncbi:MAG: hypothetical protein HOK17_06140 [Flammeovirgaceae bacterium]|jgi:hypothetical protein|nr:hypothetical protein [Flammeovirgaceae bacterium]